MKAKILRIEDSNGIGLFLSKEFRKRYYEPLGKTIRESHNRMEPPNWDPKLASIFDSTYYCGYKSEQELIYFISVVALMHLMRLGFIVYEIELSDFIEGTDQIIFKKEHILSKVSINDKIKTNYHQLLRQY